MLLILAYICMIINHVAQSFFPDNLLLLIVGVFAFPIFALKACDGYKYTSNFWNYIKRILIVAIISQPIQIALYNFWELNVLFTLVLGLLLIKFIEKYKNKHKFLTYITTILILVLSFIFPFFIFGIWGLLTMLCIYYFRENLITFLFTYATITVLLTYILGTLQIYTILPVIFFPLFLNINDIRFNIKLFGYKYWHYSICPIHMILILIIKVII